VLQTLRLFVYFSIMILCALNGMMMAPFVFSVQCVHIMILLTIHVKKLMTYVKLGV